MQSDVTSLQYEEASDNEPDKVDNNCSDSESDCSVDAPPYSPVTDCDTDDDRTFEQTSLNRKINSL